MIGDVEKKIAKALGFALLALATPILLLEYLLAVVVLQFESSIPLFLALTLLAGTLVNRVARRLGQWTILNVLTVLLISQLLVFIVLGLLAI